MDGWSHRAKAGQSHRRKAAVWWIHHDQLVKLNDGPYWHHVPPNAILRRTPHSLCTILASSVQLASAQGGTTRQNQKHGALKLTGLDLSKCQRQERKTKKTRKCSETRQIKGIQPNTMCEPHLYSRFLKKWKYKTLLGTTGRNINMDTYMQLLILSWEPENGTVFI